MKELDWKEINKPDEARPKGEGSLGVSHLLGSASREEEDDWAAENPIYYIEETPSDSGRKEKAAGKKNREKARSGKSLSYQRLFFPLIMLILALVIVFLFVLFFRIGDPRRGEAAVLFVQGMSPLEFSSLFYVFFFLPAVLILYYLIPGSYAKPIVLLLASLVFYSFAQPVYLGVILLTCFFNYVAGMDLYARTSAPGSKKAGKILIAIFGIAGNLLLPALFVYLPWVRSLLNGPKENVPNLALPLGLMFLSLRGIAYLVDICRGKGFAETDFFLFVLYYTFLPYIALGPIDRYENLRPAFDRLFIRKRASSLELFGSGIERFLFGFFKKTILASPLYVFTLRIRQVPEAQNTVFLAWILVLAYALWLLLELSAYADMAVGTARMLGIPISESFYRPFHSLSVSDFWRRWNITVSGWFRENIYRPIFGESGSILRRTLGILAAAGLFAAFHGTNPAYFFLAAYMVVWLVLDTGSPGRLFARFPDSLRWLLTSILLLIAAAFLLGASSANVFSPVLSLFGFVSGGVANATMLYLLRTNLVLLVVSIATASGLFLKIYRWLRRRVPVAALILLILIFGLAVAACIGEAAPDTFMKVALGAAI